MGMLGAFMPLFYLQLYAILHGINSKFAFYLVSQMLHIRAGLLSNYIYNVPLDHHSE